MSFFKRAQLGLFLCIWTLFNLSLSGQYNFNAGFEAADPTAGFTEITLEDRFAIHEEFLEKALADTSKLVQVYAYINLYYDNLRANDFSTAANFLLKAEQIVEASGKSGWKGWIRQRRAILEVILEKRESAFKLYKESILLCRESGDSLCVAIGYEQIGANYAQVDSFKLAQAYFEKAFILLEKYAPTITKAIAYSNYGILLSRQGEAAEAIKYMDKAILIFTDQKEYLKAGKAMNNIADAKRRLGKYFEAENDFLATIDFNKAHGLDENIIRNYLGLSVTYDSLRNYRASKIYLEKFYELQDSLVGIETRLEIEELESEFAIQEKELEIQKSKKALLIAERSKERTLAIFSGLFLLIGFILWKRNTQRRHMKNELNEHQHNLRELTKLLVSKNAQLSAIEEMNAPPFINEQGEYKDDVPFFNESILTDEDWIAFKINFDKSFPNFRNRLRKTYPDLTDGEERLYLFIKLNLNTLETANILGISKDSVKKNRYRLRKKLRITSDESLKELVQSF